MSADLVRITSIELKKLHPEASLDRLKSRVYPDVQCLIYSYVCLIFYGKHDWAKESEKLQTQNLLKLDKFETISKSAHFSFLENTVEVSKLIKN